MTRLLFIDDDEEFREELSEILRAAGHEVFVASDGYGGIDIFNRERIDLVLLDVKLPGLNGLDVLTYMKTHRKETKVVIVSALPVQGDREDKELDDAEAKIKKFADYFITKPFRVPDMLGIIKALCPQS